MSLRKIWQDAKSNSMEAFKKFPPKAVNVDEIHTHGLPPYPLKFKDDLGPILDKFEAAKKKDPKGKETTQLRESARKIIEGYGAQVAHAELGDTAKLMLTKGLNDINRGLG